jgi:hypothetical protein
MKMRTFLRRLAENYKACALISFNMFVMLVVANVMLYCVYCAKDRSSKGDTISSWVIATYTLPRLAKVYPGYSLEEIRSLLEENWDRSLEFEPFTQFKEAAHVGRWVNVDKSGFRVSKNNGPWPPDRRYRNVFLFGGSCTFGYGVADDETIGSHLQEFLAARAFGDVKVYNFGACYYYSTQERIQFCSLLTKGFVPEVAIFVDGPNDFFYRNDEPGNSEDLRKFMAGAVPEGIGADRRARLPMLRLIDSIKARFGGGPALADEKERVARNPESCNDEQLLSTVIKRYLENKRLIESAAASHRVEAVFVWQPVPNYKYNLEYHMFRPATFGLHTYSQYGYGLMSRMLLEDRKQFGADFLWLADMQEESTNANYVDMNHFTGKFSKEIAERIGRFLIDRELCAGHRPTGSPHQDEPSAGREVEATLR